MAKKPQFSILHTSARPHQWRKVYEDWMSKAAHPEAVEYVLCIDPRWGFSLDPNEYSTPLNNLVLVQNTGRRCYVDGVNLAARASSGAVLIVNADDQFPCSGWDQRLQSIHQLDWTGGEQFVIEVSTGTIDEHGRGIMVMPILSRARYQAQGSEVFYHEYESMFADNDFCEHARRDRVVTHARHLLFPHRHPLADQGIASDEVYRAQNRLEAFRLGEQLLKRRRASGFAIALTPPKRSIALCLSGEHFEGPWVDGILSLYEHLIDLEFAIVRLRGYTSNVYVTRAECAKAVASCDPKPDILLWLDDDNILSPAHFDKLLADLDSHPEVDGVTGWCWIHNDLKRNFMVSCGDWAPDHLHWNPFPSSFSKETQLRPVEVSGFPSFLMRYSAMEKAGPRAFLPILDERLEHGLSGEDISFCLAAEKGGARFLADPQVRVPHLKYVECEPVLPEEGAAEVSVACMMRVKNEGRWLKRCIDSVRPLCGENLFIMEDGSTDDTVEIATASGAHLLPSPFVGQGLDERRDKNWLLQQVKAACQPDWILMPDGDEELEPGGCEKIRSALAVNPPVDCFALRFLFLWDSLEQVRLDGVYGSMLRQSLFRANSDLEFRSYYEGDGHNHVGLHVSNAPGLGGLRVSPLNVFLLHYGYLFREDRIRKYRWILSIDPNNEQEDYYRHTVQGDIPEVPADAKLKHAGPLKLGSLPKRLVPKFEMLMPEPLPGIKALKVNLGCCDRRIPGYLGVDRQAGPAVDVIADLAQPWPWADGSLDEVLAHDVIEHLPNRIQTMNETWRVLKPDGRVEIIVPTTEGSGAFQDPTHVSFWNRRSFLYFEAGNMYRERFARIYGIEARFAVIGECMAETPDGPKLKIQLRKVA